MQRFQFGISALSLGLFLYSACDLFSNRCASRSYRVWWEINAKELNQQGAFANALASTTPMSPKKTHSGSSCAATPITLTTPFYRTYVWLKTTIFDCRSRSNEQEEHPCMRMCCGGHLVREPYEQPPNQPLLNTRNENGVTTEDVPFLLVSLTWCPCPLKELCVAHGTHRSFHRFSGLGGILWRVWNHLNWLSLISV